jgi:Fe-S cluster assembly protein SufD
MERVVEIYKLQELPNVLVGERNKHKIYYFFHSDGSIDVGNIDIVLDTKDSVVELRGAITGKNSSIISLSSRTSHKVGNNRAFVEIKTMLEDTCIFNYTGMIDIYKNAQKSDSYLQQENLIASDDVVCNSSPQLEIKANDVKASHGVTVGSFDINQIFYLKSRGFNTKECEQIIAEGFLSSVFKEDLEEVKSRLNVKSLVSKV